MIINTRERAVSTDINRLQSFMGAGLEELLRYQSLAGLNNDTEANGVSALTSSVTTPLTALIINGMLAQPQIGSTDLFIHPGVAMFTQPDAVVTSDDTFSKLIIDPGVNSPGALVLSPNAGPGDRIDVVEVQRQDVLLESSSRDIFNTATGFFAPATVDKVKAYRGSFRIRTGTPGGGYPGNALGWLPLMVAKVPAGAATWDTCTCWDVRPLMVDYENAPFRSEHGLPVRHRVELYGGKVGAGVTYLVRGKVETTLRHFKAGGVITNGGLDIVGQYSEPTFAANIAVNKMWNLYAVFPQTLPRWAEYTPFTAGIRKPGGFRGIPVASFILPNERGNPVSTVPLPSFTGMTAGGLDGAVCVASGNINTGSALLPFLATDEERQISIPADANDLIAAYLAPNADFVIDPASGNFPQHARSLFVRLRHFYTDTSPVGEYHLTYKVFLVSNVTAPAYTSEDTSLVKTFTKFVGPVLLTSNPWIDETFEIPLYQKYPDLAAGTTNRLRVVFTELGGFTVSALQFRLSILGWKF